MYSYSKRPLHKRELLSNQAKKVLLIKKIIIAFLNKLLLNYYKRENKYMWFIKIKSCNGMSRKYEIIANEIFILTDILLFLSTPHWVESPH